MRQLDSYIPYLGLHDEENQSQIFVILFSFLIITCFLTTTSPSETVKYRLQINEDYIQIDGEKLKKITINNNFVGPTLFFKEGDDAIIYVKNNMNKTTSIHWHGLLVPGIMDGVSGFNNFTGIESKEIFTYRFKIRQSGTYWYHAHSEGQGQDGLYGSIVIAGQKDNDLHFVDRDYVILLSDFHSDKASKIMRNLKISSEFYQYDRRTIWSLFKDIKKNGTKKALSDAISWGKMRMLKTDLADVTGYTFLINGKTPNDNWTGIFKPNEKIRLRFINGSAMTFFDVRIPGLIMRVIGSDGQLVEPVDVDEFRIGVSETYDVIIAPTDNKSYSIVAESIDRTGFALGTLAIRHGLRGAPPLQRKRTELTMADMDMKHSKDVIDKNSDYMTGTEGSGWIKADSPLGNKVLSYRDLKFFDVQEDVRKPTREIIIRLGGNMERYIWTMNGKKYVDAEPINLNYGERVKLTFINNTMMAHPMHLHGMFVQLENGQSLEKLPNKHVVVVAPGDKYSALLTANELGEWAFHCHLLYHNMSGMMRKVIVARLK